MQAPYEQLRRMADSTDQSRQLAAIGLALVDIAESLDVLATKALQEMNNDDLLPGG